MNKFLIVLSFLFLCVDSTFSMNDDSFSFRERYERAESIMYDLIDDTIWRHALPDQDTIDGVASTCLSLFDGDDSGAFSVFCYQLPDRPHPLLEELTTIFHDALIKLADQYESSSSSSSSSRSSSPDGLTTD